MIRWAFAFCAIIVLTGCTTVPYGPGLYAGFGPGFGFGYRSSETYVLVTRHGRENCYTRIIQSEPANQVCMRGDFIRYSEQASTSFNYKPLPAPALALLFGSSELGYIRASRPSGL